MRDDRFSSATTIVCGLVTLKPSSSNNNYVPSFQQKAGPAARMPVAGRFYGKASRTRHFHGRVWFQGSFPPSWSAGAMMDTRSAHKTVIRPSYNELATLSCNRQQTACAGDMGKCADSLRESTRHAHTDIIDDRDPETKQVSGRETSTEITDIGRGEVCYNNELGASPPRD